jgi:hypothetical protein
LWSSRRNWEFALLAVLCLADLFGWCGGLTDWLIDWVQRILREQNSILGYSSF